MTTWSWLAVAILTALVIAVVVLMRQQKWRDSMSLSILGWLLIAVLIGGATSGSLLWLLGWPTLPRSAEFTTAETLDLLKIALAVIAGFGGVVVLSVNHRKQRFTEKAHVLAEGQEQREQTKLFNERFAAAAEQLAHERAQVRLAGVCALAGLADDWSEGRQQCVESLIAYLRLAQSEDRAPGRGEDEVVGTILRTFRDRLARFGSSPWSDLDFDFTGMTFVDADFSELRFDGKVTFDDVTFTGATARFDKSWFVGTLSCRGTRFTAGTSTFRQAWLDGVCEFVGVQFDNTVNMTDMLIDGGEVRFSRCEFTGDVRVSNLVVEEGALRLQDCLLVSGAMDFDSVRVGPFGPFFDDYEWVAEWVDLLLGRKPKSPKVPVISILRCELEDFRLVVEDAFIANGRLVIRDSTLRDSSLRVDLAASLHPSLLVRCLDAVDSVVDIPVEPDVWAH